MRLFLLAIINSACWLIFTNDVDAFFDKLKERELKQQNEDIMNAQKSMVIKV